MKLRKLIKTEVLFVSEDLEGSFIKGNKLTREEWSDGIWWEFELPSEVKCGMNFRTFFYGNDGPLVTKAEKAYESLINKPSTTTNGQPKRVYDDLSRCFLPSNLISTPIRGGFIERRSGDIIINFRTNELQSRNKIRLKEDGTFLIF